MRIPETAEELGPLLQKVQDQLGYFVCAADRKVKIGEVHSGFENKDKFQGLPYVAIAETDRADYDRCSNIMGTHRVQHRTGRRYYRCKSE